MPNFEIDGNRPNFAESRGRLDQINGRIGKVHAIVTTKAQGVVPSPEFQIDATPPQIIDTIWDIGVRRAQITERLTAVLPDLMAQREPILEEIKTEAQTAYDTLTGLGVLTRDEQRTLERAIQRVTDEGKTPVREAQTRVPRREKREPAYSALPAASPSDNKPDRPQEVPKKGSLPPINEVGREGTIQRRIYGAIIAGQGRKLASEDIARNAYKDEIEAGTMDLEEATAIIRSNIPPLKAALQRKYGIEIENVGTKGRAFYRIQGDVRETPNDEGSIPLASGVPAGISNTGENRKNSAPIFQMAENSPGVTLNGRSLQIPLGRMMQLLRRVGEAPRVDMELHELAGIPKEPYNHEELERARKNWTRLAEMFEKDPEHPEIFVTEGNGRQTRFRFYGQVEVAKQTV